MCHAILPSSEGPSPTYQCLPTCRLRRRRYPELPIHPRVVRYLIFLLRTPGKHLLVLYPQRAPPVCLYLVVRQARISPRLTPLVVAEASRYRSVSLCHRYNGPAPRTGVDSAPETPLLPVSPETPRTPVQPGDRNRSTRPPVRRPVPERDSGKVKDLGP